MWLFGNKDSGATLGTVSSIGLSLTNDPVPGFSLIPSDPNRTCTVQAPYRSEWRIRRALHRKKNNQEVTMFSLSLHSNCLSSCDKELVLESLRQTVKWMKALRHPNILNWLGGTELSSTKLEGDFHIITEHVVPLREYLRMKADSGNFNFISSWGVHQISRALAFLNDDAKLSHNAVRLDAIFVSTSGEWRLGGLDFIGPFDEPPPTSRATAAFVQMNQSGSDPYSPPDNCLRDAWGLGCMIWEIFNPDCTLRDRAQLTSPDALQRLPKCLVPEYRRLVAPSTMRGAKKRFTVAQFLEQSRNTEKGGFFVNQYVDTLLFLEEIQLKDAEEKTRFLASLPDLVGSFPDDVCRHKIMPHLLNDLRYGSAGVEALIPALRLLPLLSPSEFEADVLPCLVKLFASPERATRVRLLEQLPNFVTNLPMKVVESQIFTPVAAGFSDANPIVREATVRAMVHLAPKLSSKLLNDSLPRYLIGVLTKDNQGGIRTNATVCLAKLASQFSVQVQQGALLNAFLRSTRDPFVPCRKAALAALAASQELYTVDQLASKVMPCLSFLTVDPEKSIREDAFRAIRSILDRLEQNSENPQSKDTASQASHAAGTETKSGRAAAAAALGNLAWSALSFSSRWIANASVSVSHQADNLRPPAASATVDDHSASLVNEQPVGSPRSITSHHAAGLVHGSVPLKSVIEPTADSLPPPAQMSCQDDRTVDDTSDWGSLETTDWVSDAARNAPTISHTLDQGESMSSTGKNDWDVDRFFDLLTVDAQSKSAQPTTRTDSLGVPSVKQTAKPGSKPKPIRTKSHSIKSVAPPKSTVEDSNWDEW